MIKTLISIVLLLCGGVMVQAGDYRIDHDNSSVTFSGVHAGNNFAGSFGDWEATISFDPDDLDASKLTATFDLSTAKTGNAVYDGALPEADWFKISDFPHGRFDSTAITANADGSFRAEGTLTLRDIELPVAFDFSVEDPKAARTKASAEFTIDRLAYDIGKQSDPDAEWVTQDIMMRIDVLADRQE